MAEEQPDGRSEGPRRSVMDAIGGGLGLLVFLLGIALLIFVFVMAWRLYEDIGPTMRRAQASAAPAAVSPVPANPLAGSGKPVEGGPVQASPAGQPLLSLAAEFGLRLLMLIVLGVLATLLAGSGARLAGAHRGKPG